MVRLIDCEVYAVESVDITRLGLLSFFCNNHTDELVAVYSGGKYEGVISYSYLLNCASDNIDDAIIKEKYICKAKNASMFTDLSRQFKECGKPLITILDEYGQILYFAFWDESYEYESIELVLRKLETNRGEQEFFVNDIYPNVKKVRIENLNEYAFRFYKILKQRKFPVEVCGEKWKVFFPDIYTEQTDMIPDNNVLKIYADGVAATGMSTAIDIRKQWDCVIAMELMMHNYITEKYREYFESIGVKCLTAYFPLEAPNSTADEVYRHQARVRPAKTGWGGGIGLPIKQMEQVYGGKIDEKKWNELVAEREKDSRYVHGIEEKICYGTAKNRLYLIGPCIVYGLSVPSLDESLGACINEKIRQISDEYAVEGRYCGHVQSVEYENTLKSLSITENDIVVLIDQWYGLYKKQTKDIIVEDILEKRKCDWFYDCPIHTNYIGNEEISKVICKEYLAPIMAEQKDNPQYLQVGKPFLSNEAEKTIDTYIEQVRGARVEDSVKIGSIVMNCNPMTNGHLYLINTVRSKVDLLYIFVVEEDKSFFSFTDRLRMVKKETECMENVKVVPSGKFVLSYITMPLYFEKEEKKSAVLDAMADLKIFGSYIAPKLGISVRFVGEEPMDFVTRQYNNRMKDILPQYGIEVVEVPRFQQEGRVVSASLVRKNLKEGKMDIVKELVPSSVYSYLNEKFGTGI